MRTECLNHLKAVYKEYSVLVSLYHPSLPLRRVEIVLLSVESIMYKDGATRPARNRTAGGTIFRLVSIGRIMNHAGLANVTLRRNTALAHVCIHTWRSSSCMVRCTWHET